MEDKLETPSGEDRQSLETLDAPASSVEPGNDSASNDQALASPDSASGDGLAQPGAGGPNSPKPPKQRPGWLHNANLYLGGFILLVAIALGVIAFVYSKNDSKPGNQNISSQNLTPDTLKQLASSNSNVNVGDSNQVLTVRSNAIFSGQVLAQKSLEVAGDLKIGGNLSLPRVVVSGTSQFGSVQINKDLSVGGKTAIQGTLAVQNSLSVSGSGHFNGPISAPQATVSSLQLNGDLNLTHHINAGGSTPGASRGSAVGSGGSASVGGSDTAGSIRINTGGNPPAGCFITVRFAQAFHATPHIVVTPIGSSAGRLSWYVNRSTTSFSVCTASTPPAYASLDFDYIAFD